MKDKNIPLRLKDIKHIIDQNTSPESLVESYGQTENEDPSRPLKQIESAEGNEKIIHKEHINRLKKPRKRRRTKRA